MHPTRGGGKVKVPPIKRAHVEGKEEQFLPPEVGASEGELEGAIVKDACTEKTEELRQLRNQQRDLAQQLGTPDSDVVRLKQESALRAYQQYRAELIK